MNKPLTPEQLKELVSITSEKLRIKYPSIIEKDYYITSVIHVLSDIENEYFRLIFAGGTCLAKAHKLVKRMSEDIDFKIHFKGSSETFSNNRLLTELKKFRKMITTRLERLELASEQPVVRNGGQYSKIEIHYPTAFSANSTLRPDILLEFTLSNIRLAVESLPINTLIEDNFKEITLFQSSRTSCISVDETAIEKWVGLTRRIVAIERGYHPLDKTLIRHVYDLNAIKIMDKINANFFTLANAIISNDSKQFKNQHPEYAKDPCSEIIQSVSLLKTKPFWEEQYKNFLEGMVYEPASHVFEYSNAIKLIEQITEKVIDSL